VGDGIRQRLGESLKRHVDVDIPNKLLIYFISGIMVTPKKPGQGDLL